MAREHANIRLDMWADSDWRALSRDAQWFYELLLTHPKTNRAGVSEWHPGRLSTMASGTSPVDIVRIAVELVEGLFIAVDAVTEEVLVRSYIKHDGVLKQPNMTTTMANDYAGVASPFLRGVVAFEIQKLRDRDPDMAAWGNKRVRTILDSPAVDVRSATQDVTHAFTQGFTHPVTQGLTPIDAIALPIGSGSPTSTSTSTKKERPASSGSRLSPDWVPSAEDVAKIRLECPGVDPKKEHAAFVDYWIAVPGGRGLKSNWGATWRNWMRRKHSDMAAVGGGATQASTPKKRFVAHDD